jgi:hypothetical protein
MILKYVSSLDRKSLSVLLVVHGFLFWSIAALNLPLAHDTMINFQVFATVYSSFSTWGEFPLWMPLTSQGITADFAYAFTFTPAFYLAAFIGKLFSGNDSLLLFRLGLYLEEVLLLYGLYRLSTVFHSHRITPIIVSITGVLSVSWVAQIHWNFHLIYLYPLLLYHTVRYLQGGGLEHAACALILMTLGGLFYPQIFIAFTLCAFAAIWIFLMRPTFQQLVCYRGSVFGGLLITTVAFAVAFLNVQFARHVIDGMQSFTSLRQADGSVGLETFLTYGGHVSPVKFMEFIYGAPVRFAFVAYSGLFTVLFVIFALVRVKTRCFWVFMSLTGVVLLFSLGASGYVAEIAYRFFPEMDKFRHIGFVTPVAKILLIIASGFGIDYYLQRTNGRFRNTLILFVIALALGMVFLLIDISHGWQYAYAVDQNLIIPFQFHWIQWGVVLMFTLVAFGLLNQPHTANMVGITLLLCVLFGMGSYKYFLEWHSPAMKPESITQWQTHRHAYDVRPLMYSPTRQRESDKNAIEKLSMMEVWGAHNSLGYGSLPVDLCFPVHRVDLVNISFFDLIASRLGSENFSSSKSSFSLDRVGNDKVLMDAIGCNMPKLYLAKYPIFKNSYDDAKLAVKSSSNLYANPIIQKQCNSACESDSAVKITDDLDLIEINHFSSNQMIASVNVPSGSNRFLVYLDSLHSGWKAMVDGVATTIYPANIAFKAIELPPGAHEIEFSFAGGSNWSSVTIWTNYILSSLFFVLIVLNVIVKCLFFNHRPLRFHKNTKLQ